MAINERGDATSRSGAGDLLLEAKRHLRGCSEANTGRVSRALLQQSSTSWT
jgi:hypothetical protein